MRDRDFENLALRGMLALIGVISVLAGLNIGLGRVRTLGWQDSTPFLEIANAFAFRVHDSQCGFSAASSLASA